MIAHILSQSHRSSTVSPGGKPGTPTDWLRACRTVAVSLPWAPNSGHSSTLGEHVDHGRSHSLADRVAEERRVRGDRTSGCRVGDARDGVDHLLAAPVDGDLQSPLGSGLDQLVEGLLDSLLNVGHYRSPPW